MPFSPKAFIYHRQYEIPGEIETRGGGGAFSPTKILIRSYERLEERNYECPLRAINVLPCSRGKRWDRVLEEQSRGGFPL